MKILDRKITLTELMRIENKTFFDDMIKAVVDVDKGIIAVNAALHADLESYLLENNSSQSHLYGINILEDGDIEYDSLINPPRNRDAGFPRAGRTVADPKARQMIEEIVSKWIQK